VRVSLRFLLAFCRRRKIAHADRKCPPPLSPIFGAPDFVCPAGQYRTPLYECEPVSPCDVNEYEASPPTVTSDRICGRVSGTLSHNDSEVTTALRLTSMPRLLFSFVLFSSSRIFFVPKGECDDLQVEVAPPTTTSDRLCERIVECRDNQFEKAPLTLTSNRVCQSVRQPCVTGEEILIAPPTPSSDRLCEDIRECQEDEFELVPPTNVTNR
jgi:hypothetical protein